MIWTKPIISIILCVFRIIRNRKAKHFFYWIMISHITDIFQLQKYKQKTNPQKAGIKNYSTTNLLFLVEGVAEEGAVHDGATQGQLVGVLDLVAHTDAARQDGDFDVGIGCQTAEDVEVGGVALHRGTQGQDHLLHPTLLDALLEAVDLDVGRADTVHGRNQSAQHMIQAIVLMGVLDAHHVLDVLDNADGARVARRIAADGAHLGLADVVAHAAVAYLAAQPDDGLTKVDRLLLLLLEQVQHKPQGRLAPDSRQLGKLADRRLQQP